MRVWPWLRLSTVLSCDLVCLHLMKVISSTCPLSSKTTGSSSVKDMEFNSFWTPYASIMGETPFPKVYTYIVFPNTFSCLFFSKHHALPCTLGRTVIKRVIWVKMTFVPSGRLSAASSSTTSARACHRRRCTAFLDTWLLSGMRTRWGGEIMVGGFKAIMHLNVL